MLGKPLVTFRISLSREYLFAPMVQGSQKRAEHKTNVTWEKKKQADSFSPPDSGAISNCHICINMFTVSSPNSESSKTRSGLVIHRFLLVIFQCKLAIKVGNIVAKANVSQFSRA